MTVLPPAITANSAQNRLDGDGLASLGLTMPLLSTDWSDGAITFDQNTLELSVPGMFGAPFRCIRVVSDELSVEGVYALDGSTLTGPGQIFKLHPQAARRLETLLADRIGAQAAAVQPIPSTMVVRIGGIAVDRTAENFAPGEPMGIGATVTFHDARGLIIDPVAAAGLLSELLNNFAALDTPGFVNGGDTVHDVAALGPAGSFVHVIDPHGAAFFGIDGVAPRVVDGATDVGPVPATGLVELTGTQSVGIPDAAASRLRIGWYRNDTLDRDALTPPAPAVPLHRRFVRAVAVDLDWHLVGNRSDSTQNGIGPADQRIPPEFRPQVHDRSRFDLFVDGVDTMAAASQIMTALPAATFGFMASMAIEPVGTATVTGANAHWPAYPPAVGAPGAVPGPAVAGSASATWSGDQDVVVTIAGGVLPVEAHARVFPQEFVLIDAITTDQPSFVRADGAARVVPDANPVSFFLANPLGLPDGVVRPADSTLTFDMVVTDRGGNQQTHGAITVPVTSDASPATVDDFAENDPAGFFGDTLRSLAPSPLFGVPNTLPPGGGDGTVLGLLRALASEGDPRIGPRLPSQARFPTLVTNGTVGVDPVIWDGLLTGARWQRESRSADPSLGDPGGPAGPDLHAVGCRVDGGAAFDLAQIAMRRVNAIIPTTGIVDGWIPFAGTAGWDPPAEPADDTAPAGQTARTSAVAVLRTIGVGVESPELSLPAVSIPAPDASVQDLVDDLLAALGLPPDSFMIDIAREEEIVREIRREMHWSKFGARDAQWALRRAIGQARDTIFVASPQFCATAQPPAAADHEVDLIQELDARMGAQQSLRVIICTPRWPDPVPLHGGWVRQAFEARNQAIELLQTNHPDRVVAFHPRGYPGRAAAVRTTTVVVDDVWSLVGTSHWRRRGMTFDEGVDIVGLDRTFDAGGASARIRDLRQAFMAELIGVDNTTPEFVRLFDTRNCFRVIEDLVDDGGLGRLSPFWSGPTDTDVAVQDVHVADPDGGTSDQYLALFASLLGQDL